MASLVSGKGISSTMLDEEGSRAPGLSISITISNKMLIARGFGRPVCHNRNAENKASFPSFYLYRTGQKAVAGASLKNTNTSTSGHALDK